MDRSSLRIFPCLATGGGGGGELFCQLNQSCWKFHEMGRSSLRMFPCLATGGREGVFSASWTTKVARNCMKWIDPVSEFPLFGHWGLFCQVPDEMFKDACNMVPQSYITWQNASRVSHQKAESVCVGGGGGVAFRLIWINLRFRRLINIGLSINERPIKKMKLQIHHATFSVAAKWTERRVASGFVSLIKLELHFSG